MAGCVALIVAAGRGVRFGGDLPKQYRRLGGVPVLRHSLEAFARHPHIDAVRAVIHPDDRPLYDEAAAGLDLLPPVAGGAERQDSVRLGLESLESLAPDHVLIHDAARPFIDGATIARTIEALGRSDGALVAVPVVDTLKRAGDDGTSAGTVDRAGLWRAQTPQGFRYAAILAAHRAQAGGRLTDDAAVAEQAGIAITLVPGSEDNFKVTTESDLARAERLLAASALFRTGMGFDVHAFGPGDHVWLCGVKVPFGRGLVGHSDSDVALHALTDALLGALGAGDIGSHFPDSDPQWKGASSDRFVAHAADLVRARGGVIVNVDVTVICEAPRLRPHNAAMVARIAEILGLPADRVSVKATTTEKLGFAGRGEGIAAQAVATVRLPN
ncbi:MAG TPA: bifunctional 2-C-methyl-D-erythritol 4-phosphate cytidylyltransferase/2-C-methyl-D-erythritol 2,4-cyclodiphosphate synthase [Alphaproteobacteria bacterium]